jgi:DNA adenine methylase
MPTIKPILKWAGGKTQLLADISNAYPDGFGDTINKFVEPFVGGGAVLFDVLSKYQLEEVYISDINAELINMYIMVRDHIDELIEILSAYQQDYIALDTEGRKDYYYNKRDEYNLLIQNGQSQEGVESAALFIFLNRTCFNGLYRANKSGLFNVPTGDYANPLICNEANLRAVSEALENVHIICADYSASIDHIDQNTLVYLDPPYRPLKGRDSFTSYTEQDFDDSCQKALAGFIEEIDARGAYIILSNSDPKNVDPDDDFFDDLFADYDIQRINAKRRINRNSDHRGYITELLIKNY